ncbi:Hypothetical_protein [Hexamita inflata]|uniref:Hypothetical_protein n=1 Tax=Hexamita inflata TaxID=28002 RepID=A0AA86NA18_9EUKA|nr:Hypothetical protein HINF_LOCUS3457 [Hexamita inflata]CAI9925490.1 Hypothetical protein HINF_LOCUS13135 [Hexamita inflata]
MVQMNKKRLLTQNRKQSNLNESLEEEAPKGKSEIVYLTIESQGRYQRSQTLGKSQLTSRLPPAIYPEIRNLQNQINQEGPQVPNQVNETMHQRQPSPSNANTMEQPPVQAEGNNEQRETETREPVSGNQVSESGKTGSLTTP